MVQPILYSGTRNASSWAMRAWLALREAGVDFREDIVDIRRPQRFGNLARVGAFSPPASVPVLVVGETVIFDSIAIMEYASECADGALLPALPLDRARARSVVAWQHAGLSDICARISFESAFYPCRRSLTETEHLECQRLFQHLEQTLRRSTGPFLFGLISLADLMLVPTVLRLSRHDPDLDPWPRTQQWMETLLDRPAVCEWVREANALAPIWYDNYLVPGTEPDLHS